jgi:hypothetical protein
VAGAGIDIGHMWQKALRSSANTDRWHTLLASHQLFLQIAAIFLCAPLAFRAVTWAMSNTAETPTITALRMVVLTPSVAFVGYLALKLSKLMGMQTAEFVAIRKFRKVWKCRDWFSRQIILELYRDYLKSQPSSPQKAAKIADINAQLEDEALGQRDCLQPSNKGSRGRAGTRSAQAGQPASGSPEIREAKTVQVVAPNELMPITTPLRSFQGDESSRSSPREKTS